MQPGDTPNPAARAAPARELSAAMGKAETPEATPRAEAPAWAVECAVAVVVVECAVGVVATAVAGTGKSEFLLSCQAYEM